MALPISHDATVHKVETEEGKAEDWEPEVSTSTSIN